MLFACAQNICKITQVVPVRFIHTTQSVYRICISYPLSDLACTYVGMIHRWGASYVYIPASTLAKYTQVMLPSASSLRVSKASRSGSESKPAVLNISLKSGLSVCELIVKYNYIVKLSLAMYFNVTCLCFSYIHYIKLHTSYKCHYDCNVYKHSIFTALRCLYSTPPNSPFSMHVSRYCREQKV